MSLSPRDNARPVCLDTPLEARLAIELLSTVQTQPHESADAKRSLGLDVDAIRKRAKKPASLFYNNDVLYNQYAQQKAELVPENSLNWTCVAGTCEVPGQRCHLFG